MNLWQDVRFGTRMLVKDRAFSLAAIFALGLGIAVNTTIFTLVNAVFLRGLPVDHPERFVAVMSQNAQGQRFSVSMPDLEDVGDASTSFEDIAYWIDGVFNLSDEGRAPDRYEGPYISTNTFEMLGEQPVLGRGFRPEDDEPGAAPVVLIGHRIWTNRYGGDPAVLGRTVRVNGLAATIAGVMPEGMRFPPNSDIWVPIVHAPDTLRDGRRARSVQVLGLLDEAATLERAAAEVETIGARLADEYPDTNAGFGLTAISFNERVNGSNIELVFSANVGAVFFVLLIACTNVANLSLARSTRRIPEISVRASLGATRWRIVRQLLVESVLLAVAGGVVGLGLAIAGIRLFDAATIETGKPYWMEFTLDPIVFGFLAFVCLGTGLAFGLVPALHVSKTDVYGVLKDGGRTNTGGRRTRRWAGVLVTAQLALTLVLLAGAGFMVRSLLMLYNLNLNVDTAPLVVAQVALPSRDYPDGEARVDFFRRAEERLAALAEVDAMAFTTNLPGGGGAPRQLTRDGDPLAGGETRPIVTSLGVSPGYFDTLGLSLVRGRAFTPMDGDPGYENAIVNQRLAAVYFRGREPIGQRIRFEPEPGADETPPWLTIVGIAPDVRQLAQETEIGPVVYVPHRMQNGFGAMLVARSRAPLAPLSVALRSAMGEVDPDLPLYDVQTLNQFLDGQRWAYRVFGSALAIFAFIALVLSAVGLYAITAYSVTQRTPEVGIRMALGAQPPQIWWMFLRRSLVQTGIGLVLGLAGAAGVGRLLQSLLIRIGPSDPVTLVSIGLLLAAVAAAAFVWPVRRAIRIDPVSALRYE